MKIFFKYIVGLLLITSCLNAKVGVCEVQPEDKKEQYLECLVKEAERTNEIADINMVGRWYEVYMLDNKMFDWYEKSIIKGLPPAITPKWSNNRGYLAFLAHLTDPTWR